MFGIAACLVGARSMSRSSGDCWLYHGPGAQDQVLEDAQAKGRLMGSYGDANFNIEVARKVVSIMNSTPVGDRLATLVAGPLDEALLGSLDPLLKAIEEFDGSLIQPYLWAHDLGGVSGTIMSRCFLRWCPGEYTVPHEVMDVMERICQAAVDRELDVVIDRLSKLKGQEQEVFQGAALHLSTLEGTKHLRLWERVREQLGGSRVISCNEMIGAFLLPEAR